MTDSSRANGSVARRQAEIIADLRVLEASPDRQREVSALVREAAAATDMPMATVNLLDRDSQRQIGSHGFAGADTPREHSVCAEVTGWAPDVYAFEDLAGEAGFIGNPWVDGRLGQVRAYASAPLIVDDTTIGTLCVFDAEPRALTLAQCDRLAELAASVVDLIQQPDGAGEPPA